MEVKHAIMHRIDTKAGSSEIVVSLASEILPVNDTLSRVAREVRDLYSGNAVYGVFQEDVDVYRFQSLLRFCIDGNWEGFYDFTKKAIAILRSLMKQKPASVGGYIVFLRYTENAQDYLFVMMLSDKVGVSVTDKLTLKDSIHLDLSKLFVAARINITRWEMALETGEDHKYVSFIRARRKIADYFVDFVGCSEMTKPKESTRKVISILNDFMDNKGFDTIKKDRYRDLAKDYLQDCALGRREASLETLSNRLNEDNPNDFLKYASAERHEMNNFFFVDKPSLARLTGITFKEGGLSIKMSAKYVRKHVSIRDDQLVIKDVADELKNEIMALI